ncbi:MAG: hypothetical protein AVDCRST_MAG64-602, partial [uncultured Phycisphaerae bacterium]
WVPPSRCGRAPPCGRAAPDDEAIGWRTSFNEGPPLMCGQSRLARLRTLIAVALSVPPVP